MKRLKSLNRYRNIVLACIIAIVAIQAFAVAGTSQKPRIIVTQDGEGDDQDSMVRFLLYSCDYDVVGIVENNSKFQASGHSKSQWIQKKIDAYAQVLPNLRKHNPDYPDPDYLKSVIKTGNELGKDLYLHPKDMAAGYTDGSKLIVETMLDNDPRPIHVPAWGGANTTAYALWKMKQDYSEEEFKRGASKIRVYSICYNLTDKAQDGGTKWIIENMPEVIIWQSVNWSRTWNYWSCNPRSNNPEEVRAIMTAEWLNANVKTGHGALGAAYGQEYVSEGDTPSFLALINNGLDSHTDYTLGGWGGRAVVSTEMGTGNYYIDAVEDPTGMFDGQKLKSKEARSFWRWTLAIQNDFAARMDWCVATNYKDANHNPKAKVAGALVRTVSSGETVTLDASSSTDPDGNKLTFKWWQYHEADSAEAKVAVTGADTAKANFVVPDESGKQIHIILEVTDNGSPPLTHYQRIICSIR